MASLTNLRMDVCTLTFGGTALGHTKGGIVFKYAPKFKDITVDQYGETPIDKVLIGEEVTIKVNLAEPQVAQLNQAMPAGGHTVGASAERLAIGTDSGYSTRADGKALVLHPVSLGASTAEDITIYKAVASEPVELNFEVDNQRVYEVTFTALIDETNGNGRRLGHIGSTNVS